MARGRPRKAGKRHPNGKLKHLPSIDRGSEWVQSRVAKFGTHYNSALGRAYAVGLLGDEVEAQDRYLAGKRFARAYNRIFGGETYRCALDTTPRGAVTEVEASDYDARDREWLVGVMCDLDAAGLRPWLDQLISRLYTDQGPPWLERFLDVSKGPRDQIVLDAAVSALDILSSPRKLAFN